MPDYKEGKIYKIVCEEKKLIYYGSTTQSLHNRLIRHKSNKNGNVNKNMEKPKIYLIENYPCDSRYELMTRERYFIENNQCINKIIPTRTKKEYNKECRQQEKNIIYMKKYREVNKKQLAEKKKNYHLNNREVRLEKNKIKIICECGCEVTKQHIKRHQTSDKHKKLLESKKTI